MAVIAIATAPGGLTRVFFDCSDMPPDPADEAWIRRSIESCLQQDILAATGSAVEEFLSWTASPAGATG